MQRFNRITVITPVLMVTAILKENKQGNYKSITMNDNLANQLLAKGYPERTQLKIASVADVLR